MVIESEYIDIELLLQYNCTMDDQVFDVMMLSFLMFVVGCFGAMIFSESNKPKLALGWFTAWVGPILFKLYFTYVLM